MTAPFTRIYLGVSGSGVSSFFNKSYSLTPGSLHIIPAFAPVKLKYNITFKHYFLHLHTQFFEGLDFFSLYPPNFLREAPNYDVQKKGMESVLNLLKASGPATHFEVQSHVNWFLSLFYEGCTYSENLSENRYDRFRPVLQYIEQNLSTKINVPELSTLLGLNAVYFSNLFTELFGVAPNRYVNRLRIERAQLQLWNTTLQVGEIARNCGIDDQAYFNRLFKSFTGVSPLSYRANRMVF